MLGRIAKIQNWTGLALLLAQLAFAQNSASQNANIEKFKEAAEVLKSWGIELKPNSTWEELIISSNELKNCNVPVCNLLRKLSDKVGTITITLRPTQAEGLAPMNATGMSESFFDKETNQWRHFITLNTDETNLADFKSGKNIVLRHELQHALLSTNRKNHFLNGWFSLKSSGYPNGSGYWDTFHLQELFTFVDQNRQIDLGKSQTERLTWQTFGEDWIEQFLTFMKKGEETNWTKKENFSAYNYVDSEEKIIRNAAQSLSDSPNDLNIVMTSNYNLRFPEKYKYTVIDRSGATYTFYSDYPFPQIRDQMSQMFKNVRMAARPFLYSIYHPHLQPMTKEQWKSLVQRFKSKSEEFRFKDSCTSSSLQLLNSLQIK